MSASRYRTLNVYIQSKNLVKMVYALLTSFPKEEEFALCNQLRRAVISIPSNIAEGMARSSAKEQTHFLEISYGSLIEVQCQLEIAMDLGYITPNQFESIDNEIECISKMLSGLRAVRIRSTLT